MRLATLALVAVASFVAASPASAIECLAGQHVQHNLTMENSDGKLQIWGNPRNFSDECVENKTIGDSTPRWVLAGFPGEFKSADEAHKTLHAVWKMTQGYTEDEWNQAMAFLTRALKEGTQGAKPFRTASN